MLMCNIIKNAFSRFHLSFTTPIMVYPRVKFQLYIGQRETDQENKREARQERERMRG